MSSGHKEVRSWRVIAGLPRWSTMKLLIAEDDAMFRRLLVEILSPDYELEVAEDGMQAWEMLQTRNSAKIAVLDWVMPGIFGTDLCRMIRKSAELSETYIILLTSRNSGSDITSGLQAGADDYVTKPFCVEELRASLRLGQRIVDLQTTVRDQRVALASLRSLGERVYPGFVDRVTLDKGYDDIWFSHRELRRREPSE